MHWAALNDQTAMVKLFLERGQDVTAKNNVRPAPACCSCPPAR